jgi:TolA-binding protein
MTYFSCAVMQLSDCVGSSQTFSMPPFSIAPEDVDTEIESDDGVHDIDALFNRLHDLERQVREKEQTVHEQTAMLMEKAQTLRERDQTIQKLLARQGRFKR